MQIDPVLFSVLATALALLFTQAAWGKLHYFAHFQLILQSYQLFPSTAVRIAAGFIVALEVITALCLWIPSVRSQGAWMAGLLLSSYAAGMAINLLRHRRLLDCGCHLSNSHLNNNQSQPISWMLVGRNLVVATTSLLLITPPLERSLTLYDFSIITVATGVCTLLYAIVDCLIANQVRLSQES